MAFRCCPASSRCAASSCLRESALKRAAGALTDPSSTTLQWSPQPGALPDRPGYAIGRRIGAGGLAEVYEAELRRPPLPAQRVALKRLLPGLRGDAGAKQQLRREAQLGARLLHENIVKVLELLELDDEPVLVMELCDGLAGNQLLHRLVQQGQALRLPAIAYLLRGLFSALDYLTMRAPQLAGFPGGSARPLVHADISLENLMVTTAGSVKLIDFGLAGHDRSLEHGSAASVGSDESLTELRQLAGKRSYAPPGAVPLAQQARASALTIQNDLYAAGVCAWELLTGLRFPVLPEGAAARELGSLIAFAGDGLPEAGWRLLTLCLMGEPPALHGAAEQGLGLLARLGADTVSPKDLGALVQALAGPPLETLPKALTDALPSALTAPLSFPEKLLRRLRGAFCARDVVALVEAPREDAGWLYFPLRPSAAATPSCVLAIDPGPGRAYDPLAEALLRGLLGQNAACFARPAISKLK